MIRVFFSYAHEDEEYRDQLEIHLSMLRRQGIIESWHDRRIEAGKDIHGEISEHLESAHVILLLVSPYFLASDYCYDVELAHALERHEEGRARVIPVIIHPCDWKNSAFGQLRATPPDGKPISKFANFHDAYLMVVEDIRRVANELAGTPRTTPIDASAAADASQSQIMPEARSSNLRVKQEFSDRDRDQFVEASFEYIANFFENSLAELETRHPGLETRFKRTSGHRFTAAVYMRGEKRSSCRVWVGDTFAGDIAFADGDSGTDNSYNEALSVTDDGYSLLLQPLGLGLYGSDGPEGLTQQGAAEYLWTMLIDRLQ